MDWLPDEPVRPQTLSSGCLADAQHYSRETINTRVFFFNSSHLKNKNKTGSGFLSQTRETSPTKILYYYSWLARTDPRDVARVESKTVIVTKEQKDTVPTPIDGGVSQLGRWMSPEQFDKAMAERFPGCMKGTAGHQV